MKNLIGKVARCKKGITGLITGQKDKLYVGVALEGDVGSPWQSLRPRVIGDMDDYVESRYNELEALSSYR